MAEVDVLSNRKRPGSDEEFIPSSQNYIDEFIDPALELEGKFGPIDPEVQGRLIDLFATYNRVHVYLRDLERRSKNYSAFQTLHFKYVLDSLATTLIERAGDIEKQCALIDSTEDYLKDASIDIVETLATEVFSSIVTWLKKPRFYYTLAFFSLPDKSEIKIHTKTIKHHLRRGSQLKNTDWELCFMEFNTAYEEILILKDLLPNPDEARRNFYTMLISITALVLSVVLPIIFHFMQR